MSGRPAKSRGSSGRRTAASTPHSPADHPPHLPDPDRQMQLQQLAVRAILFDAVGTLIYPHPPVGEVYGQAGRRFGSARSSEDVERRFRAAFAHFGQQKATRPDSRRGLSAVDGSGAFSTEGRSRTYSLSYPDAVAGGRRAAVADQLRRPCTSGGVERARWRDLVVSVFDDVPDAGGPLFEHLWQHFAQPDHWRAFNDVEPTLEELARRGLMVGIASNFDQRIFAIIEEHPVLHRWFDRRYLFVSAHVGFSKPDPRFFRHVERSLGLPPGRLLLVGDDPINDVAGAHAAGWHAAYLARHGSAERPPEQPGHFGEVERMAENMGNPTGMFCPPDPPVLLRRLGGLLEFV